MRMLCFLFNHYRISDQRMRWANGEQWSFQTCALSYSICSRSHAVRREVEWRVISRFLTNHANPIASRNIFNWKKWMNRKESAIISKAACCSHGRALSREAGLRMQSLLIHPRQRSLLNPFSKTLHAIHSILRDVERASAPWIACKWNRKQEQYLWKKQGYFKDKTMYTP